MRGVGARVHAAEVGSFHHAHDESNWRTREYFQIMRPKGGYSAPLTHFTDEEGVTWCRDNPKALAALRVATALL